MKEGTKFVQVREKTGGGVREIEMESGAGYSDVMEKAMGFFFPNGRSSRGRADNFYNTLGDFKQSVLKHSFTVGGYIAQNCLSTRPRIYLISQKKEEDKFELPDLDLSDFLVNQNPCRTPEHSSGDQQLDDHSSGDQQLEERSSWGQQLDEHSSGGQQEDKHSSGDQQVDQHSPGNQQLDKHSSGDQQEDEHSYGDHSYVSPVSITYPRIPTCQICRDRYCDTFLDCGHILCFVCSCELEERGSVFPVCRSRFKMSSKIFY